MSFQGGRNAYTKQGKEKKNEEENVEYLHNVRVRWRAGETWFESEILFSVFLYFWEGTQEMANWGRERENSREWRWRWGDETNKTKQNKNNKKNTQKNKPSEGGRGEEEAPDDRCAPSIPYTLPRPRSPHPDFRVSWVNRPLTLPSVLTAGWPIMASPLGPHNVCYIYVYVLIDWF